MSEARVIRKYPNRRLYDTAESRYVTLNDIRRLVVNAEPFKVIDKKSGENITRSILLHVIAEQEETGRSVMSEEFLAHVIRAYADDAPKQVRGCLEDALAGFLEDLHSDN
ncbi:MAG: polyhydroxyalkanoate synthesis repressor PhaR [Gammaproteobacteria bacterium]